MKKQILKYSLILLTLIISFYSWRSVNEAINVSGSSDWLVPAMWFSFLFIIFSLSTILIKEKYILALLFPASLLLSCVFILSVAHLIIIIFSSLLLFLASLRIKKDLNLNVKINLWKSVRMGRILIIVALSIVITGQYYFSVKDFGASVLIPQLKPSDITNRLTAKVISMVSPEIKISEDEDMTVDQFILQSQKKGMEDQAISMDKIIEDQFDKNIPPAQMEEVKKEALKNINSPNNESMILEESRKQLSEIAGKELVGNEKISEIISEMINNKINNFLGVSMENPKEAPLIPIALAIIIFLTVISLGSFLSPLWILLAVIIFAILVKTKMVQIKKVPVEMEVIK